MGTVGRDWDTIHWALDHYDYWLASRDLAAGDDFTCSEEQGIGLRPYLQQRGLDVVVEDGRGYVMSAKEAATLGPAGPAYGSHPVTELTRPMWRPAKTIPEFPAFGDDDEPTEKDIQIPVVVV